MTHQNLVTEAQELLSGHQNAESLVDIFQDAVNSKAQNFQDPLEKMHHSVMLASDDPQEISTFAKKYAEALHTLGVIQQDAVQELEWKDLMTASPEDRKKMFNKAAGKVMLIKDAFGVNTIRSRMESMMNSFVVGDLCEILDKAGSGYVIKESADKPVVILSGATANISKAYEQEPDIYAWRFPLNRIGF